MIAHPFFRTLKRNQQNMRVAKATFKKLFLSGAGFTVLLIAQGQDKKQLVEADLYFASGEYLTAAHLYQQYLHPVKKKIQPSDFPLNSKKNNVIKTTYSTTTAIELKQAESYRLANYWKEAAALYLKIYEKNPVANDTALYWYAVCQRSLGNYTVAEAAINRFINETANVTYKSLAATEIGKLKFIKSQVSRPDTVLYQVQRFNQPSVEGNGVFAPIITADNHFLFTSTQTDSNTIAGVNPHHNRLFRSQLQNDSLQSLEPLKIEGSDESMNQGAASLSADGNHLYFTQWKKENGKTISSIYFSIKKGEGWSQPVLLSTVNQNGHNSKQPFCTADGQYLFFASDREGGYGGFDIWFAPIQTDGTTGEAVNAGRMINTADNEQAPFYHNSTETLVFSSDRTFGMGGYDLFSAIGKSTLWEQPENMGYPINSSRDDIYFFTSTEGSLLRNAFISSDRGADCCLASFAVRKADKKKIVTGVVRDCETNELLTGVAMQMKDVTGKAASARTDDRGQYLFDMDSAPDQWNLSKDGYSEKDGQIAIERINKSGWLVDTLYNEITCIEKKKLVIKVENVVTLYFDFDQSRLKDRGLAQMDSIYTVMLEHPMATIQISGYTDGRGSAAYNQTLSDKRAKSCADYLIKKGIEASRISFASFGSCCPVEMELINGRDNPDGRSSNRRALINITKE